MEFLGIGWLELFLIFIIILLVAGPNDIQKGARALGRSLNRLNRSANYQMIRRASQELRNLPARLAQEAQLEEIKNLQALKELKEAQNDLQAAANSIGQARPYQAWVEDLSPPAAGGTPAPPAGPPTPAAAPPTAAATLPTAPDPPAGETKSSPPS